MKETYKGILSESIEKIILQSLQNTLMMLMETTWFPIYLPEKRVLQVEIVLIEHLYYLCSTRINNFYCIYL